MPILITTTSLVNNATSVIFSNLIFILIVFREFQLIVNFFFSIFLERCIVFQILIKMSFYLNTIGFILQFKK